MWDTSGEPRRQGLRGEMRIIYGHKKYKQKNPSPKLAYLLHIPHPNLDFVISQHGMGRGSSVLSGHTRQKLEHVPLWGQLLQD